MNQSTLGVLENRLRMLYAKLPPVDKCRDYKGCYLISHEALYAAAFILHQERALSFMAFLRKNIKIPSANVGELSSSGPSGIQIRDAAYLRSILKTHEEHSNETCRSYIVCQWAAHCLFKLLNGQSLNNQRLYDYWKHLSPVTGYLLQHAITVVASDLVMQTVSRAIEGKQNVTRTVVENHLEYPTFTFAESPASSMSSEMRYGAADYAVNGNKQQQQQNDTSVLSSADADFSGPLVARYGAVEDVSDKLRLFETMEEVMGTVWEKIKDSRETTEWILGHAFNYEH